ncbi:MAG: hypothetical protein C4570_05020 [Ammonifex sp.]|jgi:hypothetical protein|nr:MAG: hypothetical protein C4570_05020 [Ammonifex sp.]
MEIKTNKTDLAAIVAKGALGLIPCVGPLAAEVIGTLIPNQRLDRIQRFLEKLEERVNKLDRERVEKKFHNPGFVDLLEDGFYQAARALTEERLNHIANLVAKGISQEEAEYVRFKKMLSILSSLNDVEVLFLIMYGRWELGDREFMEQHKDILSPKVATMGSSEDELEAAWIQDSYKAHLVELGLLRPRFNRPRKGELPEFDDKTGTIKASGHELTPLGRMLLKYIGQPTI